MDDAEKRLIQEFSELQDQVLIQADMANKLQTQERMLAIHQRRSFLTKEELQGMPDQTPMYKSIGRAPKDDVVKELEVKATQLEGDAQKLKEQREALEAKMGDTESQIRELLKQSPSLVRRLGAIKI